MNRAARPIVTALALTLASPLALAQDTIVVPRAFSGVEAPGSVNTLIRDQGQPRTYQQRWAESDISPAPVVAPNANAGAVGNLGLNTLIRNQANPRTYQFRIRASELAGIPVGAEIDRIAFRLDEGPASWPPAGGAEFSEYRITLAQDANPAAALGANFFTNQLNPVLVRRGRLVIPEGAFTGGTSATVQPFGRDIRFQRPYTYQGGNLLVTISHNGSNLPDFAPGLDAQSIPAGDVISAVDFLAATGTVNTTFTIVRLGLAEIPVGSEIAGVRWRLNGGTPAWPLSPAIWVDYPMFLSEDANPAVPLNPNFATNELRTVQVRSGPLTVPILGFLGGLTPNDFAPTGGAEFNGRSFVYPGGNLIFRGTHPGSNQTTTAPGLDGATGNALSASTFNAASGTAISSTVTQVVHCPTGAAVAPLVASNFQTPQQFNTLLQTGPRTYQAQYTAAQLAGLEPGDLITEIQFRSDVANPPGSLWPPADVTYADYEITLSQAANAINNFSPFVPENQLNPVLVRTGPLTIPANSLRQAAGTDFDFRIPVAPYQYRGGDLVVTITHSGRTGPIWLLDADNNNSNARGSFANSFRAGQVANVAAVAARFVARDPETADVLYTNGTLVNRPFAGPLENDFLLQSTLAGYTHSGIFALSEDFPVLAPFGWRISGAEIVIYRVGIPTTDPAISGARIELWRGVPRAPGSELIETGNAIVSNVFAGAYSGTDVASDQRPLRRARVFFSLPVTVGPGTYHLAWTTQASGPAVFTPALADTCVNFIPGNARQAQSLTGAFDPLLLSSSGVTLPFKILGEVNPCVADINFDGAVDFNDLLEFINLFNSNAPIADLNADGVVDFNDLLEYLNRYNAQC